MLQGKALGAALKGAIDKKKVSQLKVAQTFGVQQPSVSEWIRYGRIAKKHLNKLVEYFSDVVGPEHWGLPASGAGSGDTPVDLAKPSTQAAWPFERIKPETWESLPDRHKGAIEQVILEAISDLQNSAPHRRATSGADIESSVILSAEAIALGQLLDQFPTGEAKTQAAEEAAAALETLLRSAVGTTTRPTGVIEFPRDPGSRKPR
jgi:hypothetical protein